MVGGGCSITLGEGSPSCCDYWA